MSSSEGLRQRRADAGGLISGDVDDDTQKAPRRTGGRFELLCWLIVAMVTFLVVAVVMLELLIDSPIDPVVYSLKDPPVLTGPLSPDGPLSLTKAERILEGKVLGPESIVVDKGHIYTGTADGKIVHIYKGAVNVVANIGSPPCGGFANEPTCGRPLGMRLDAEGYLIVADAYLGLFKVNVATGDIFRLYSSETPVEGTPSRFFNDLDIADDGTIYLSDSSTRWQRREVIYEAIEARSTGRLLKFDPKTSKMSVLADGLTFANGVQLSKNGDFLLVVETTKNRIMKYHIKGAKAGQLEVFADNLPGFPDNIRRSSSGGFWVGFAKVRHQGMLDTTGFMSTRPWIRKFAAKVLNQQGLLRTAGSNYGLIVELGPSGEVLRSLHDPTGKVIPAVSEVEDDQGVLYLGSYYLPFLGRLNTNQK